jgi:hypothetical protein
MVGGYGSDDKVEIETGDQGSGSQIPGVLADVSTESSTQEQAEPSGLAGALELGSDATDVDNLSGGSTDYTSGGGTSGFGKGT